VNPDEARAMGTYIASGRWGGSGSGSHTVCGDTADEIDLHVPRGAITGETVERPCQTHTVCETSG